MSFSNLNSGNAYVTGDPWGYQDADLCRTNFTDHETRILATEANTILDGNGGYWLRGMNTVSLTLSTTGTATDSTGDLLPANSYIAAVTARVTTTIATATDWSLGTTSLSNRFNSTSTGLTAGSTVVGLSHVDQSSSAGPKQVTAGKVRVTTTGTPSAGVIRVTVYYSQYVAPTA